MRKLLLSVFAGALLVAGTPLVAGAGHCDTNVVIFSRTKVADVGDPVGTVGVNYVNYNAGVCAAAPDEEIQDVYDTRLIHPGANQISVRYTEDVGADVPTLSGTLDGLGFENTPITLTRLPFVAGGFTYDSPRIDIPGGPTATGSVTATVVIDPFTGETDSATFHTLP